MRVFDDGRNTRTARQGFEIEKAGAAARETDAHFGVGNFDARDFDLSAGAGPDV